jgi:pimeloyl-ACP methyl ester carboxylesterase
LNVKGGCILPFVERGNAKIWYNDQGQGSAVLLIHGGMMEPMDGERFWEKPGVAPDLVAAGYHVLVPDRRYSGGRTSAPFERYWWEVDAADTAAVLRHAGVEHAHVVSGSNGCSAAIRFALSAPAQVRSLLLCWPAVSTNTGLHNYSKWFELSEDLVSRVGPAAYLEDLRAKGFLRPNELRPRFPFGVALLHDEQTAATFCRLQAAEAAQIMRDTARVLRNGDLLRGVTTDDARKLGSFGFPIFVMPADPEDPPHPLATAQQLATAIAGARLLKGFPETPRPDFPPTRAEFNATLAQLFSEIS